MQKRRFIQFVTVTILFSFIFMLASFGTYLYKKHLSNKTYEGNYMLSGNITEVGKGTDNNYLIIRFSNNQNETSEKLVSDYNSKMIIPPDIEQKKFKNSEFKIGDLVLVNFNNKSKIISNITHLGRSDQILSKASGKVMEISNSLIKIRTIEQISQELNFDLNSNEIIYDKTTSKNQKITLDKIKVYDDIEVDYSYTNNDRLVRVVYLTKKGPNNR